MSDAAFPRLLRLLQLLPPHPRTLDTTQLTALLAADGFDTTPRTVQRDLLKLEGMGFGLQCLDDSKPYRWRLAPNSRAVMVPGLDVPQALALLLVEAHLSRLVPRAAWAALRGVIAPLRVRIAGRSRKGRRGSPCAAPPSASLKAASTSAVPTCSPRSNRFQSDNKAASAISVRAAPPEMAMRLPREATRTPSTCSTRAR